MAVRHTIYYKREKDNLEVRGSAKDVWWIILLDLLKALLRIILVFFLLPHHTHDILSNLWSWVKRLFGN
jgi:hypothetical protein